MLHVVHEVEAHRLRRSRVERGEDAGESAGRHALGALEAGIPKQADEVLHAFLATDALGGDGGLVDPVLQALHGLAVTLLDLALDRGQVRGAREAREHQGGRAREGAAQQRTSGEVVHAPPSASLGQCVKRDQDPSLLQRDSPPPYRPAAPGERRRFRQDFTNTSRAS